MRTETAASRTGRALTARDFRFAQLQATIFTPDEEVSSAKLARDLIPLWAGRFDGEPMILPTGQAMPREIPKLILASRDQTWKAEIASERVNLYRYNTRPATEIAVADFFDEAARLLEQYIQLNRARVGRIASVCTRYAEHETPALLLARHFCKERWASAPLNRPESFELHAHKTFMLADRYRVNSWVRNKTGHLTTAPGEQRPVVIVEQDLNTLADETTKVAFEIGSVHNFFSATVRELDVILRLYYPEEGEA